MQYKWGTGSFLLLLSLLLLLLLLLCVYVGGGGRGRGGVYRGLFLYEQAGNREENILEVYMYNRFNRIPINETYHACTLARCFLLRQGGLGVGRVLGRVVVGALCG